jgi:hypothetical protein
MTDEQLSGLAELTLLNASVLGSLAGTVSRFAEQLLPLLPDQSASGGLLSDLKQLQGIVADLPPALARARKDLGLS